MRILVIILSLACFAARAQNGDSVTTYFDDNWHQINDEADADYYRKAIKTDGLWVVRDYFISGNLQMSGAYLDKEATIKTGRFNYYYKNGQLSSTGEYINGKKEGGWLNYYEEGNMSSRITYGNDTIISSKYWDKAGKEAVVETLVEQMPEFPGGMDGMSEYLSKSIRYPKYARKKNIEGRVILQFVVGIDGDIMDIIVLKSVHPLLDEEAVRVIKKMPRWKPGMQNNKRVMVRFTLPLRFKLN